MTVSTKGGNNDRSVPENEQQQPSDPLIGSGNSTHLSLSNSTSTSTVYSTPAPAEEIIGQGVSVPASHVNREEIKENIDEPMDTVTTNEEYTGMCFPMAELSRLDDMINRPRWVIPVLPRSELEVLLDACISLATQGLDQLSEPCQRFYREGLTISFTKILTDEAVNGWKPEIHRCIFNNCEKLIDLIVLKLDSDCLPLLELLSIVFNPNNKFHSFTSNRIVEQRSLPDQPLQEQQQETYAKSNDSRTPRHYLIELLNRFGRQGGFELIRERFEKKGKQLSIPLISALIRPFGLCYELLTVGTIENYLMPIAKMVPKYLENLTDDELKKESKNDALSSIIKSLKNLATRIPNQDELIKSLEHFRLRMILKLLQISSYNGKMNALNELNRVIANVAYFSQRTPTLPSAPIGAEDEEWLSADKLADWLKENNVLKIVLRDSLHQPQYVEKLEKIIRFVIKEKTLTLQDLDDLWSAQAGKHEAIVKNVHDLLAKLAWDFTPEQLDHLFSCFQSSWRNASKKQREKLLELIRRLAEDDKDGVMAHKVLHLLWNLAHQEDVPNDIVDQALAAHVKILDYSCSQDRDTQKTQWLEKCIEELKVPHGKWVLPALKQMREICCLYSEAPPNFTPTPAGHNVNTGQRSHCTYRHEIISKLQLDHTLVILVSESLSTYMNTARRLRAENPKLDPTVVNPNSRFSHIQEVQERLNFLRFLLKDGQMWLCSPQAKQIWTCLAENAAYPEDREICFKWFSQLMTEEPDLDPDVNREFFEANILQLDPSLVTESGIECFERFFKAVNLKEGKLIDKKRSHLTEDLDLIGLDYLWKVVLNGSDEVSLRAIELLKETFTRLGPSLQSKQIHIHDDIIASCTDRLRAAYDTVSVILGDPSSESKIRHEVNRITRVLKVLHEYIFQCDSDFGDERTILPMALAYRGSQINFVVRFPIQGRQMEDFSLVSHTNDTLHSVKRQILHKTGANANTRVELFLNGELIDSNSVKLVSESAIKDKVTLTGKLFPANSNLPSSPDSSSESSTGSPQNLYETPNIEAEHCLPGVILSKKHSHAQFFFQLADLGMQVKHLPLVQNALAILKIMPADAESIRKIKETCFSASNQLYKPDGGVKSSPLFDGLFFTDSPTEVAYNLLVIYSLLVPAQNPFSPEALEFQYQFIRSGCGFQVIDLLTKNNFISKADDLTKLFTYLVVLKIAKVVLVAVAKYIVIRDNSQVESQLSLALNEIPNPSADCVIRDVAFHSAEKLIREVREDNFKFTLPQKDCINSVIRLAWSAATGKESSLEANIEAIRSMIPNGPGNLSDFSFVCKEALEVLSVMFMLSPQVLEEFSYPEPSVDFCNFIIDLLLISPDKSIRTSAFEQFSLIATKCDSTHNVLVSFIHLLFKQLGGTNVDTHYENSKEFFQLMCCLLHSAASSKIVVAMAEEILGYELDLISNVKSRLMKNGHVEEVQLEGHLGITKEIIALFPAEIKHSIGCDVTSTVMKSSGSNHVNLTNSNNNNSSRGIIKILIDEYIFPASRSMVHLQSNSLHPTTLKDINPICSSPATLAAAFDVLVSLCTGCVTNLNLVAQTLTEMFYSEQNDQHMEWEYLPPIGPRPNKGFVGLKNAGATCYMNSVLQQLYMIPEIRNGILSIEGAINDPNEDFSSQDKDTSISSLHDEESRSQSESRSEYHIGVLKYVQAIFGHLALSKLQYYEPRGFWKHFKLSCEPLNLREQHDALEFFNSLVDSLDEALKSLKQPPIMSRILGGTFADQKICKGCPHRYSREESFTSLNIDIRNHSNLLDSLEQYVKGDLLEGADAYHCEKCNRKVDTVKRLCIKKLPPILAIQLKRFDYDWERETAIKFNDYFEFPRSLDMEPYTVSGLAKIEGEVIDDDIDTSNGINTSTKYELCGIVVHSGQATGGHYYSYILYTHNDGTRKWYKFDDVEVTECKLDDDEEMRNQAFGGEYMGEVFDHMLKRMSNRRQKRWWNAYILIYRRIASPIEVESCLVTQMNHLSIHSIPKMPMAIQRSVQTQNIKFMHNKNQYSSEYFHFMKKLLQNNANYTSIPDVSSVVNTSKSPIYEIAMTCTQLGAKFLFCTCLHTKKSLRGPATDWYEVLACHMKIDYRIRGWFVHFMLFEHPYRLSAYLLESQAPDVRSAFAKIISFVCCMALNDGTKSASYNTHGENKVILDVGSQMSDKLMQQVLSLLKKEIAEYSRNLVHYFGLFANYATISSATRIQLLKLNVVEIFMSIVLEEGPGPTVKYQYADFSKLYQVVSILVRSCRLVGICQSSVKSGEILDNPYGMEPDGNYLWNIQPKVHEMLIERAHFVKKLIEDATTCEETIKLFKFCSWENYNFTSMVMSELLWHIAYSYSYELKPHLDLLMQMLLIEDSWQEYRIHAAFNGIPEDREGIFDTIARNKSHYGKRVYQCIKCVVALCSNCPLALRIIESSPELKSKWSSSVKWLQEELERRPYPSQYNYNSWSPPAPSNESNNGYFLERSPSAHGTLSKALELLPNMDRESTTEDEKQTSPPTFSSAVKSSLQERDDKAHSSNQSTGEPGEVNKLELVRSTLVLTSPRDFALVAPDRRDRRDRRKCIYNMGFFNDNEINEQRTYDHQSDAGEDDPEPGVSKSNTLQ